MRLFEPSNVTSSISRAILFLGEARANPHEANIRHILEANSLRFFKLFAAGHCPSFVRPAFVGDSIVSQFAGDVTEVRRIKSFLHCSLVPHPAFVFSCQSGRTTNRASLQLVENRVWNMTTYLREAGAQNVSEENVSVKSCRLQLLSLSCQLYVRKRIHPWKSV